MRHHSVLRASAKILIPPILLFALYVQFHGDFGPGGGFQAGVIFAVAFILYALVFGLEKARRVAPPAVTHSLSALGVMIYAGVGFENVLSGGNFLEYNVMAHEHHTAQHLGIFLVEMGVGITVCAVMITIFFSFAGRGR
ncbi:MAG: Na(+)/H(+) antiporter subunit B [Rhodospirillum sp.]|nr:Na(+)/H(+) antiporter subunit B [Rhodospirillum sp.]MCF8487831.1 Na(+)/H(+) antiporter subunit B [Rhodospirillum sp.]MCF8502896.1 Na(+)/H(+) antiporter subunit B [Rhodospirillum sp.]